MNAKRKAVEEYLYKHLDTIDPTHSNSDRYKRIFAKMNDAQFDVFMQKLRNKQHQLYLIAPTGRVNIKLNDLFKAAKELGVEFFEQIWLTDTHTGKRYLTPNKYIVIKVPIRRLKQYLVHKMSLPKSDKKIDYLTGQVILEDRASNLSFVEVQELYAYNFKNSLLELFKVRGGDIYAYQDMKNKINETGTASLDDIAPNSMVRSTVVLSQILNACMLANNYFGKLDS
jgi:hypothetical protein